jgi:hypothetical protein
MNRLLEPRSGAAGAIIPAAGADVPMIHSRIGDGSA